MRKSALTLIVILLFLSPSRVFAHTTLVASDPVHDSVIQSWPDHITLTFGEPLQLLPGAQINRVSVTNANAVSLEGVTTVNGAQLSVVVGPNTVEGPVLVNYRIAAADGHVLEGEYAFSFKKGAVVAPTSTQRPHHGTSKNLPVVATSTTLVVLGLLFGLFTYRRLASKD